MDFAGFTACGVTNSECAEIAQVNILAGYKRVAYDIKCGIEYPRCERRGDEFASRYLVDNLFSIHLLIFKSVLWTWVSSRYFIFDESCLIM